MEVWAICDNSNRPMLTWLFHHRSDALENLKAARRNTHAYKTADEWSIRRVRIEIIDDESIGVRIRRGEV